MTTATVLTSLETLAQSQLKPLANKIDQQGLYPREFLHEFGKQGGFSLATTDGSQNVDLAHLVQSIAVVGRYCGSTAFLAWCQAACAWYLQNARVPSTRERYFEQVATAERLSGTGMSNTVKHLAGIERIHLKAKRTGEGYVVTGTLPWVSNVDEENLLIVTASVDTGGYVMFLVEGNATNLTLRPCPEFSGMEGTATYSIHFRGVEIEADQVIAHPEQFAEFIEAIKPGFVITQCGIGLGVVDASLKRIADSNVTHSHVNQYLDDQQNTLQAVRDDAFEQSVELAQRIQQQQVPIVDVLKLRATASELTLRAANSAVLHAGARGYLKRDPAQRLLREAVFVGIVTPALKHLRKEIHDIEEDARAIA